MAGGVASGGKGKVKADINVTPLVDVVFVLLIIFMVVTPMLASGKEVALPQALSTSAQPANAADRIVVTITAERELWVENAHATLATLESDMKARLAEMPAAAVLVKADASVSMADVRPVMKRLKALRVHQVAFIVAEGPPQ